MYGGDLMTNYQLLLVSTLSYLRIKKPLTIFSKDTKYYVKDIFNGKLNVKKNQKYEFLKNKVSFIEDFLIIDYTTTSTGMASYCLESDDGELVYGFCGTDILDIRDLYTDFKIAVGKDLTSIGQFHDALIFVKYSIFGYDKNKPVYFTGHSLGGGLAQYCAYSFSGKFNVKATTFNGVGVYQNLENSIILKDKNVLVDYSFMDDIVGGFGEEFGTQKYVYVGKKFLKNFTHHGVLNFYDYFFPCATILKHSDTLYELGVFYTHL